MTDNNQNAKIELVVTALQQRIGEMSADYETKIAVLRAEFTMLQNEYNSLMQQNATEAYSKEIEEAIK